MLPLLPSMIGQLPVILATVCSDALHKKGLRLVSKTLTLTWTEQPRAKMGFANPT